MMTTGRYRKVKRTIVAKSLCAFGKKSKTGFGKITPTNSSKGRLGAGSFNASQEEAAAKVQGGSLPGLRRSRTCPGDVAPERRRKRWLRDNNPYNQGQSRLEDPA